ncbi:MAG TPA: NAD(P)-dependent oxidoreductase [Limnochordia bacterium]
MRVIVTGALGYIARQVLPGLSGCELVLTDLHPRPEGEGSPPVHPCDLLTAPSQDLVRLFQGCDAVIHCAHVPPRPGASATTRSTFDSELKNVQIAHRVLESALAGGVRRVILTSSNHAADWYERPIRQGLRHCVGPETPPRSDNYYGWAKIAYEALGFLFACGSLGRPLEVVAIRIGAPRPIRGADFVGRPAAYHRNLGAYISPRDLQQLYRRALEADTDALRDEDGVPFQIFYGISNNRRAFWDISNARRRIGYAPVDDSEVVFADEIRRFWLPEQARGGDGA